ncbi:MAG: DUF4192 domain-containing protein, partial [Bifidobacteriaceae bacterium]|nr:DUF4192 domain-containing protein [Bifidobacteriaceae bacterium]
MTSPAAPAITIAGTADLLSLIPHHIGYTPRDSLVVMGTGRWRSRFGVVVRVDLASIRNPQTGPWLARHIADVVADDGATGAVVVRYASPGDPSAHEDRALVEAAVALRARLDELEVWEA